MKLLTKKIEEKLAKAWKVAATVKDDPEIVVHYFNPSGAGDWYVLEGLKLRDGDWKFYGLVDLQERELGYFTLSELTAIKCPPFGLGIERDMYFGNKKLSDVQSRELVISPSLHRATSE